MDRPSDSPTADVRVTSLARRCRRRDGDVADGTWPAMLWPAMLWPAMLWPAILWPAGAARGERAACGRRPVPG
jgi:hypothetical protein